MAQSRTERIGTIFWRVTSLIRGGALKEENIPLWYNIYKAFPPKLPPQFNRKLPDNEIQPIFYPEDRIRAKLHADMTLPPVNLKSHKVSHAQIFLTLYESLIQAGNTDEEAYKKALDSYKMIFNQQKFSKTSSPSPSQFYDTSDTSTKTTK